MQKLSLRPASLLPWLPCCLFAVLGLIILLAAPAYEFSGLIFLGIAGVILLYRLLALNALRHKKTVRVLRILLTVCLGLGLGAAVITGFIIAMASFGDPETECQYIVVLGAGVDGMTPSLSLQSRLDAAYAYLTAHPNTVCIVSGGQGNGEDISEAQCMYNDLTVRGISPNRVWMEDQASNTRENLRFSLDLIESRTGTRPGELGLVSSEYHLYRAGLFAREQGITASGIPAKTSRVHLFVNYFLREIAAVWYYTVFGG